MMKERRTMQVSSDIQFKVGDKAVYPAQGVAEVVDIEEKDIAGSRQRFYVLRILDTDRKILVPVKNADAVGLRQVITEQEIQEIFDILRERTIAFDNQTWNRRYRGFMDKIKTGSIYDVAEVLRDLYRLKTDKQLSFGERRMLDTARSLIVKEIAIARNQTEEQVKNEIEAIFFTN
jgi:CarD family transcriptional regulator